MGFEGQLCSALPDIFLKISYDSKVFFLQDFRSIEVSNLFRDTQFAGLWRRLKVVFNMYIPKNFT